MSGKPVAFSQGGQDGVASAAPSWVADNGDGTFTNPLFYEEFSDPDIIRVGEFFYMTGTTMHTMPGLPVLRSTDLVNWEFLTYVFDVLDLGPSFRLEGGEIYGQGIWAPCLRHRDGVFYIFANINRHRTQLFTATDPAGPWTRTQAEYSLHDLSVLFDDDGKAWAVSGYRGLKLVELDASLTRIVPGSERELFAAGNGEIGEGVHFYKIDGTYLITSAWFAGRMRMPAARTRSLDAPWEVHPALSIDEDFGLMEGWRIAGDGLPFHPVAPFDLVPPNPAPNGRVSLHQGGIVDTPDGEWWGWSMMDYNSIGRLTALSPVTWQDGWPYFGLPGNLGRTPRTWLKPNVRQPMAPRSLFERSDDFDGSVLKPIWQWNHVPVPGKWSLAARAGHLRLHTQPAESFWWARNTLTQRAVGPISSVVVKLDAAGLGVGDNAGLGLLGLPWRMLGVRRRADGLHIEFTDQQTDGVTSVPAPGPVVWLRADCNFLTEQASFSWSTDGESFTPIGEPFVMVFQLKTFQGIRYALFAFGDGGGHADFDSVTVIERHPRGLMQPIPLGETGTLELAAQAGHGLAIGVDGASLGTPTPVTIRAMGQGRVALVHSNGYLQVAPDGRLMLAAGEPGPAAAWQWIETPTGEVVLMSIASHRFLRLPTDGPAVTDSPGPLSDGSDNTRLRWRAAL